MGRIRLRSRTWLQVDLPASEVKKESEEIDSLSTSSVVSLWILSLCSLIRSRVAKQLNRPQQQWDLIHFLPLIFLATFGFYKCGCAEKTEREHLNQMRNFRDLHNSFADVLPPLGLSSCTVGTVGTVGWRILTKTSYQQLPPVHPTFTPWNHRVT